MDTTGHMTSLKRVCSLQFSGLINEVKRGDLTMIHLLFMSLLSVSLGNLFMAMPLTPAPSPVTREMEPACN